MTSLRGRKKPRQTRPEPPEQREKGGPWDEPRLLEVRTYVCEEQLRRLPTGKEVMRTMDLAPVGRALFDYLATLALQSDFVTVSQCAWAEETTAE